MMEESFELLQTKNQFQMVTKCDFQGSFFPHPFPNSFETEINSGFELLHFNFFIFRKFRFSALSLAKHLHHDVISIGHAAAAVDLACGRFS